MIIDEITKSYQEAINNHGFQDEKNEPMEVYSVASGLDYPKEGPQHSYLKDIKRVNYEMVNDKEAINAFFELSRVEGIIPTLESAHAISYAMKLSSSLEKSQTILVNPSGLEDKDIDFVA